MCPQSTAGDMGETACAGNRTRHSDLVCSAPHSYAATVVMGCEGKIGRRDEL